jgi:hypothetical protein
LTRARYDAELARRRYINVDPANRLVADTLESDWNERLRELDSLQQAMIDSYRPTKSCLATKHVIESVN